MLNGLLVPGLQGLVGARVKAQDPAPFTEDNWRVMGKSLIELNVVLIKHPFGGSTEIN